MCAHEHHTHCREEHTTSKSLSRGNHHLQKIRTKAEYRRMPELEVVSPVGIPREMGISPPLVTSTCGSSLYTLSGIAWDSVKMPTEEKRCYITLLVLLKTLGKACMAWMYLLGLLDSHPHILCAAAVAAAAATAG